MVQQSNQLKQADLNSTKASIAGGEQNNKQSDMCKVGISEVSTKVPHRNC